MRRSFTKSETLELTGMSPTSHSYCARTGLLHPVNEVTRGKTPRYDLDETLSIYLMERLHGGGMQYVDARGFVDQIRSNEDFWTNLSNLGRGPVRDCEAWLCLFDKKEATIELIARTANVPPVNLYRIADPQTRKSIREVGLFRITEDVIRILEAAEG